VSEEQDQQDPKPYTGKPQRDANGRLLPGHAPIGGGGGAGRRSAAQEMADYHDLLEMFDGEYSPDEIKALLDTTKRKSVRKVMLALMHGGNEKLIAALFGKIYPDKQRVEGVIELPPLRVEIVMVEGGAQEVPPPGPDPEPAAARGQESDQAGPEADAMGPAPSSVSGAEEPSHEAEPARRVRPLDPPLESDLTDE
jgi:hypothetical protein